MLTAENTKFFTENTEQAELNQLSGLIIGCAIDVHSALGPGLLESSYKECLFYELINKQIPVVKEWPLPSVYKEVRLECGYRVDLIVNNQIIIETKSIEAINDIHIAQLITYLKLSNCKLGLLINFNVLKLKDGIKRLVNKF